MGETSPDRRLPPHDRCTVLRQSDSPVLIESRQAHVTSVKQATQEKRIVQCNGIVSLKSGDVKQGNVSRSYPLSIPQRLSRAPAGRKDAPTDLTCPPPRNVTGTDAVTLNSPVSGNVTVLPAKPIS